MPQYPRGSFDSLQKVKIWYFFKEKLKLIISVISQKYFNIILSTKKTETVTTVVWSWNFSDKIKLKDSDNFFHINLETFYENLYGKTSKFLPINIFFHVLVWMNVDAIVPNFRAFLSQYRTCELRHCFSKICE